MSRVSRARPRRQDDEDLAGQRTEVGAEVHRALQHEYALFGRLDTEVSEHRLVRGLLLATGHGDAYAADTQQGHRAEIHVSTQIEGAGSDEATIAQGLDEEFARRLHVSPANPTSHLRTPECGSPTPAA